MTRKKKADLTEFEFTSASTGLLVRAKRLLSPRMICAELGVHRNTLTRWIEGGKFPKPDVCLTARMPRWADNTLKSWLDKARC